MSDNSRIDLPKEISVVIPVFNEQDNIVDVYEELDRVMRDFADRYEIIFIDDGSTDDTLKRLTNRTETNPRVTVIHLRRNMGQTAAMAAGVQQAALPLIVTMDGDLQNDPHDIPALYTKLQEGYHAVCGWRKNRRDKWLSRKLPSMAANILIGRLFGIKIHDFGCSLRIYHSKWLKEIDMHGEIHRLLPALIVNAGGRITEVEVNHRQRSRGDSKYGLIRVFKVILDIVLLKFLHGYFSRPLHFFGYYGFICMFAGFIFGSLTLCLRVVSGIPGLNLVPLILLTMLLIIVGGQMIFLGLLAELLVRIYLSITKNEKLLIEAVKLDKGSRGNNE